MSDFDKIRSSSWKKNNLLSKFKNFWLISVLLATLATNPKDAVAKTAYWNGIKEITEQVNTPSLVDIIQQRTWVQLPKQYQNLVRDCINNSDVFTSKNMSEFFVDFITEQMGQDWGISKQNQLFFLIDVVFTGFHNEAIFDWEDQDTLNEYEKAESYIEKAFDDFENKLKAHLVKLKEESKDIEQKIIEEINIWIKNLIRFYKIYEKDKSIVKEEELNYSINYAKWIIEGCNEHDIDYKSELMKELKDEKRVNKMLELLKIK